MRLLVGHGGNAADGDDLAIDFCAEIDNPLLDEQELSLETEKIKKHFFSPENLGPVEISRFTLRVKKCKQLEGEKKY